MDDDFSGDYIAGFHYSRNYLARESQRMSSKGRWERQRDGYLEESGQVYYYSYPIESQNVAGVGQILKNGFEFTTILKAFSDQGLYYDDLVLGADSVKQVGGRVEVSGRTGAKTFRVFVVKYPTGWRVAQSQIWFRPKTVDLVSEVSLAGWTKSGVVELPKSGDGIVKVLTPTQVAIRPTRFLTAFETLKPSVPLSLKDIYRPFTIVVAGPTKTLQMTAKGELVESSGILRAQTNPWAWLYVISVAGLVFFSALLFSQSRIRRSASRKT